MVVQLHPYKLSVNPRVGALGSQVMLTFFVPFCLYWKDGKQDGEDLVVFLMNCQVSPYTWSLDIWDSSRDPLGDGSTLPDLTNLALGTLKA